MLGPVAVSVAASANQTQLNTVNLGAKLNTVKFAAQVLFAHTVDEWLGGEKTRQGGKKPSTSARKLRSTLRSISIMEAM